MKKILYDRPRRRVSAYEKQGQWSSHRFGPSHTSPLSVLSPFFNRMRRRRRTARFFVNWAKPVARHSYTDCSCSDRPGAVPRTSVPVTPATPCVETIMTKWQQFSREFSSSDSRVYSGALEAIIFILAGSTYLMTKVSMSARSGNKNRLRCTWISFTLTYIWKLLYKISIRKTAISFIFPCPDVYLI